MTDETPGRRLIRSFVRREGRLTPGQQRALDSLWPRFGLELPAQSGDLKALLAGERPVTLEIGFGNGASLAQMAAADPAQLFIGIEVHRPGVGHLLQLVEKGGLENVRVICEDAVEVLKLHVPDASLDRLLLFFADPWPKKRHHKRRIVQPKFVELVAKKLKPGGIFHMATDWENYAEHMREVMEASPDFENTRGPGQFSERPDYRPVTKFEQRGQRLGHGVWDLLYRRR
ncbi:MAG TPA: tRNA (guanosine(46)-N7)-methyltransferase TrmB [Thioalkalivibrio sp.]|nr:tRNA (guanosine(46)-N7)-methyltransferase TrmB [Thioalkalivibrio sp.]